MSLGPMLSHYVALKGSLPDRTMLLFQIGDFYEAFYEDARKLAEVMNLALTKRQDVPMCGLGSHMLSKTMAALRGAEIEFAVADQPDREIITRKLRERTEFDVRVDRIKTQSHTFRVSAYDEDEAKALAESAASDTDWNQFTEGCVDYEVAHITPAWKPKPRPWPKAQPPTQTGTSLRKAASTTKWRTSHHHDNQNQGRPLR